MKIANYEKKTDVKEAGNSFQHQLTIFSKPFKQTKKVDQKISPVKIINMNSLP